MPQTGCAALVRDAAGLQGQDVATSAGVLVRAECSVDGE